MRLDQLVGMGLRKALEFLVKDFVKSQNAEDEQVIESKPLAACIRDHIDDQKVKNLAERAVWLGNDETHYRRQWKDKDIHDLKLLVDMTVHALANVLLYTKYGEEMP